MWNKIIGILAIILGLKVLFQQNWNGNWGLYHFEEKYLFIPLSLLLFHFGIRMFLHKDVKVIEHSKCPKCKESFNYVNLKDGICPKCNIKTIEIDEYFEKYPDELDDV